MGSVLVGWSLGSQRSGWASQRLLPLHSAYSVETFLCVSGTENKCADFLTELLTYKLTNTALREGECESALLIYVMCCVAVLLHWPPFLLSPARQSCTYTAAQIPARRQCKEAVDGSQHWMRRGREWEQQKRVGDYRVIKTEPAAFTPPGNQPSVHSAVYLRSWACCAIGYRYHHQLCHFSDNARYLISVVQKNYHFSLTLAVAICDFGKFKL